MQNNLHTDIIGKKKKRYENLKQNRFRGSVKSSQWYEFSGFGVGSGV